MLEYMDNVELDVVAVKDLRMIHCYNLAGENGPVPGVMVYYGKDKVINLCQLDKCYDQLLSKVIERYEKEKDSHPIIIDDRTRNILEDICKKNDSYYTNLIEGYEEQALAICSHKGHIKNMLIPLLQFIINDLYSLEGKILEWNPISKEWYGRGELVALLNGDKKIFPYVVKQACEGDYDIVVSNLLKQFSETRLHIVYGKRGIEITVESLSNNINGKMGYILDADNSSLIYQVEIYQADKLVCHQDKEIVSQDVTKEETDIYRLLDKIFTKPKEVALPWGQKIWLQTETDTENDKTVLNVNIAYIMKSSDLTEVMIRSYSNLTESDKVSVEINRLWLDAYESNGYEMTQLHFLDIGYESCGYYKEHLADRYYGRTR